MIRVPPASVQLPRTAGDCANSPHGDERIPDHRERPSEHAVGGEALGWDGDVQACTSPDQLHTAACQVTVVRHVNNIVASLADKDRRVAWGDGFLVNAGALW